MYTIHTWQIGARKSQPKKLEHESVKRNVIQMLKTWSQRKLVWVGMTFVQLNAELNAQHSFMFHAIGFNALIDINICDVWDIKCSHSMRFRPFRMAFFSSSIFSSLQAMPFLNSSTSAKTMNEYQTWKKKSQKLRATQSKSKYCLNALRR